MQQRVLDGMGLVVLHSGHHSKPFKRLMGTSCDLKWRDADERELIWTVAPAPDRARACRRRRHRPGGDVRRVLRHPAPDELVLVSWFTGGEVFRSGCCFRRGRGRIFYFSPGHETYPTFHQREIQRIIANAVGWAAVAERTDVYNERSARHRFAVPDQGSSQSSLW